MRREEQQKLVLRSQVKYSVSRKSVYSCQMVVESELRVYPWIEQHVDVISYFGQKKFMENLGDTGLTGVGSREKRGFELSMLAALSGFR